MFIFDLSILEVFEEGANIQGGIAAREYIQNDNIAVNFNTFNRFQTSVVDPRTLNNSAAAGAKGDAQNTGFPNTPTYSYTKADTVAVTDFLGDSFSASTSAATINAV